MQVLLVGSVVDHTVIYCIMKGRKEKVFTDGGSGFGCRQDILGLVCGVEKHVALGNAEFLSEF